MKSLFRKMGLPILLLGALSMIIYACSKNNSDEPAPVPQGQQRVSLMLTDAPGLFDKVNIDIRKVELLIDTCSSPMTNKDDDWDDHDRCGWWEDKHDKDKDDNKCNVWDSLPVRPGVYDLLQFRNGLDTSLATGTVRKGHILSIRITLGNNNSLVKNNVTYPLKSLNGQVKIVIKVRKGEWDETTPGNLQLWLDFDISRSIIQVRDGMFVLKPFIQVWTLAKTGSVSGRILPKDAMSVVTVHNATDSMYAIPGREGEFKVRGLKPGTYSIFVNAGNGYKDTTITGVQVMRNQDTKVPTITLKK